MSGRRVLLVDYGVGNLLSVERALTACGATVEITGVGAQLEAAERVVLPGVGAFASCMEELRRRGLVEPLLRFIAGGRPLLGICVGMQMLMQTGEEFGLHEGLGIIPGRVSAIPPTAPSGLPQKIPHIGWSELQPATSGAAWRNSVLEGIEAGSSCYFLHSYEAHPSDPAVRLANCTYNGYPMCAAVRAGKVYGTQFHPEKSGKLGLKILSNFLHLH